MWEGGIDCMIILLFLLLLSLAGPSSTTTVPIIDITDLLIQEEQKGGVYHNAIFEAIDEALQNQGIFLLTTHDFQDPEYFSRFLHASRALFGLPMQEKNAVSIESNELRGYLSMGSESGLEGVYEPKEGYAYGLNWEQEEGRQRYKTNDMQVLDVFKCFVFPWPHPLSYSYSYSCSCSYSYSYYHCQYLYSISIHYQMTY